MSKAILPKILQVPDKLLPFVQGINDYRYFLLEGGRGGGKSQAIARVLLYLCDNYKLRVVCGREIQNSIAESVYTIFADLIRKYELDFTIYSSKIVNCKTNATINFRGFREQGAFNIQGLEGVDFVWVDEAQALKKQTIDVLIPTIRKDSAKIIFSMNRHVKDDPAYDLFYDRPDCLHIHINYLDNPFCTEALRVEAETCKTKDMDDYNHIWLGEPLDKSEDAVFSDHDFDTSINIDFRIKPHYGMRIAGFDIARFGDDKCACVELVQLGALHWEVCKVEQWSHRDLNYTTGRILEITTMDNVKQAIIDEDGLGAGPLDSLQRGRQLEYFQGFRNPPINYKDDKFYANVRTENAYKVKDLMNKGHLKITDPDLIKEMRTVRYTYDNYQRKILISKKQMRKEGIKSPNMADALFMAVSLIGKINYDQDNYYRSQQPQYAREGNLYQIGGIR